MLKRKALDAVRSAVHRVAPSVPGSRWFLFGSALIPGVAPADIDLLIVYSEAADRTSIRSAMGPSCSDLPLHLFLLTDEEERELDFIRGNKCQRVDVSEGAVGRSCEA